MTHLLLERQQQILHSTSLRAGSAGMTRQASKCKNVERCRKKGSKGCGELKFFGILHFAQDDSKGFADWGWATFAQDDSKGFADQGWVTFRSGCGGLSTMDDKAVHCFGRDDASFA